MKAQQCLAAKAAACRFTRAPLYSRSTLHGFQNTRAMRHARIDPRAVALFVPATLVGGDA